MLFISRVVPSSRVAGRVKVPNIWWWQQLGRGELRCGWFCRTLGWRRSSTQWSVPGIQVFFAEGEIYFAPVCGTFQKVYFACGVCGAQPQPRLKPKHFRSGSRCRCSSTICCGKGLTPFPSPDLKELSFSKCHFVWCFYKAFCCHAVNLVVVKGVAYFQQRED